MKAQMFTLESKDLQKSFDVAVFGESGTPVLVFPEGDSSFASWQEAGMIDGLASLMDDGAVQLFCVDSADDLGWYSRFAIDEYRVDNIEGYLSFVKDGLVPFVRAHAASPAAPVALGAGMGALNATLAVLRDPASFGGLLALSGSYDVRAFVNGEPSALWEKVSPLSLVDALGPRAKATQELKRLRLAFVCGQEQSESGIASQKTLEEALAQKGVKATFEYWGYDVSHSWGWWLEETRQLLPAILSPGGLEERRVSARVAYAANEDEHARAALTDARERLAAARDALKIAIKDAEATAARVQREDASVEQKRGREADLMAKAAKLWEERDRVAALLAEAEGKARDVQGQADAAAHDRADAEWIAGEAKAAVEHATQNRLSAEARIAECEAAVEAAQAASAAAASALSAVRAEADAEVAAAKRPAAKKAATKRPAAKKAASKKPAAKKAATTKKTTGTSGAKGGKASPKAARGAK